MVHITQITGSCNDGSVQWSGELRGLEELAGLGKSPSTKCFLSCTNSLHACWANKSAREQGKRNEFKNREIGVDSCGSSITRVQYLY